VFHAKRDRAIMIETFKKEYKELSISKVVSSIKKFNNKGVLSKKAKLISVEKYHNDGYLDESKVFYADEKNVRNYYTYETLDRRLEKTHFFLDGNIEYKHVWLYDTNNRLIMDGKYHYNYANSVGKPILGRNWKGEYDGRGNLVNSIQYSHGTDVEEAFTFKYSKEGHLIEKNTEDYKWNYIYDSGLLKKIIRLQLLLNDKVDYSWVLEYDEFNNLIRKTRYNNDDIDHVLKWEYDKGNKIKEVECVNENGSFVEYSTTFEYSENNMILKESGEWLTTNYRYDSKNLLIEESSMDSNGKIISRKIYSRNDDRLIVSMQENKDGDTLKHILLYDYE